MFGKEGLDIEDKIHLYFQSTFENTMVLLLLNENVLIRQQRHTCWKKIKNGLLCSFRSPVHFRMFQFYNYFEAQSDLICNVLFSTFIEICKKYMYHRDSIFKYIYDCSRIRVPVEIHAFWFYVVNIEKNLTCALFLLFWLFFQDITYIHKNILVNNVRYLLMYLYNQAIHPICTTFQKCNLIFI